MAQVIGIVTNTTEKFYIKDSEGNLREVQNGDEIYEGESVVPAENTPTTATITILPVNATTPIVFNPLTEQSLDDIIASEGSQEGRFVQADGLQTDVNSDLRKRAFGGDEEEYKQENEEQRENTFANLDGARTDINSDLRDAAWPGANEYAQMQNDEEDASEEQSTGATFTQRDGDSTDIVSDLRQAEWFAPVEEPIYDGDVDNEPLNLDSEPTPTTIIKVVVADENGDPIKDGDGNYVVINETPEGVNTYYIALAFEPNTTIFNDSSKLDIQEGTVDFTFTGGTAIRYSDYATSGTSTSIALGGGAANVVKADTLDDYMSDNGENFLVKIENYTPSTTQTGGYGTIIIDNTAVTTTILDDSQANTPNNPDDVIEPTLDSVTVKLVSTDANGEIVDSSTIAEGETVYYKAILLDPEGNQIIDATGDVNITFTDGTAIRTGSIEEGENDFTATDATVTLNEVFSATANDDFIADNSETFNVQITDDTYTNATAYENVVHDTTPIVTTITDDTDIVSIKLFAANKDGEVIVDESGNYQLANSVYEGGDANYIAYAFEKGENTFNDSTRLDTQVGSVDITLTNSSATGTESAISSSIDGTEDYNKTSQNITLGEAFSTETFIDAKAEGDETCTVKIDDNSYTPDATGGYESVDIDINEVTTTIKDAKVFVKIEAVEGEDIANEGENLTYKVSIVNGNGDPIEVPTGKDIKVDLVYEGNTSNPATDESDYTKDAQVTITGGNSETTLTIPTIDDYFAEGDEGLKITIDSIDNTSGAFDAIYPHTVENDAPSDAITTTGTIKDESSSGEEDTIYAIIEGPASVNEGDITTDYTIKLVDKEGNEVKVTQDTEVTVKYTNTSTQDGDTQYNNNDTITITIPANSASNTFTVDTIDDPYKDYNEVYNLEITNVENTGEFEDIKIGKSDESAKSITTTIYDNTNSGTETNTDTTKIVLVALEEEKTLADITDTDGKLIYTDTHTTSESGKLYYVAVAVDSENTVLTQSGQVKVNTTDNTATGSTSDTSAIDGSEDYKSVIDTTVNIGEVFEIQTNDDYLAEGDENFSVKITDLVDTNYENPSIDTAKDTVTSTITDNPAQEIPTETGGYEDDDTVYVIITGETNVNEGDSATYEVKLVDKDGDPVTVTKDTDISVVYNNVSTQDSDTEHSNNTPITVTILAGNSSTSLDVDTIDDLYAEEDKEYKLTVTDVDTDEFENMLIGDLDGNNKNITSTITDNPANINQTTDESNTDSSTGSYDQDDTVYLQLSSNSSVDESEGAELTHTFTLVDKEGVAVNLTADETIDVTLNYSDISGIDAVENEDFSTKTTTFTIIGDGGSSYDFTNIVADDYFAEETEGYTVSIGSINSANTSFENIVVDSLNNSAEGKITDATSPNDTEVKIILVATDSSGSIPLDADGKVDLTKNTNSTPEGGKLYYIPVAVDSDGKVLDTQDGKVALNISNGSATGATTTTPPIDGSEDYVNFLNGTQVDIGKVFEVETSDDYLAEGDEEFTVTISDPTDTPYETPVVDTTYDTLTSTITDNLANKDTSNPETPTEPITPEDSTGNYGEDDTVYVIITGDDERVEGATLEHTIKLVDKDGNDVTIPDGEEITVKINYAEDSTATKDTDYTATQSVTFTKDTGNSITIENPTKDDYIADNNESYTATIGTITQKVGEFENIQSGYSDSYKTTNSPASDGRSVIGTIKDDTDTTPNDSTDSPTEEDAEKVILKLVACDEKGDPIIIDDKYTFANEVDEGSDANYMVLAFKPGTTDFTTSDQVETQGGTVTVNTNNITNEAVGVESQTKNDGSEDYISKTQENVVVGETIISVDTIDDYLSDNDEKFEVVIADGSYAHPTSGAIYENVTTDGEVTTTITDNPANVKQDDNSTENDDPTTGSYDQDDTVYVKIINDASVVEGNDLVHHIQLVDKGGNAVTIPDGETITVTLEYSSDTTENVDYSNTREVTVTLDKNTPTDGNGVYKLPITNTTIDDFTEENPNELYTLTIKDVAQSNDIFENVAIDSTDNTVTGEILDGVTFGTPINASVDEDGLNISTSSEDSLSNSLGITNPNDDTYSVSFDKTITTCPQTSNEQTVTYSYNEDGTVLTAKRTDDGEAVFTVELKQDGSGDDIYDFKLLKPMDHDTPPDGETLDENDFDLSFKFNVTSNGNTSENQTFNVKVVDSTPSAEGKTVETNEDSELIIRLTDDNFKDGKIIINGDEISQGSKTDIFDPNDGTTEVGELTNNGDGTLTFNPNENYSNYNAKPSFTYSVTDLDGDSATATVTIDVNPVADAPTITVNDVTTTEDDGNTKEGENKVDLGLETPILSKDSDKDYTSALDGIDQTGSGDQNNGATGDNPERLGYIELKFINGEAVNGAVVEKSNGDDLFTVSSTNQVQKIVITNVEGTAVDYTYHHNDIAMDEEGVIYLTASEYQNLKIIHKEDNDTDIKINIKTTSYEVDDTNKPLDDVAGKSDEATMSVKITPETDDISLSLDGTIETKDEGYYYDNPLDLNSLLSNTSGTDKNGDLDGSEKRSYTISGIPEGTIIKLDGKSVIADSNGDATIEFPDNTKVDPEFTMQLPEDYSGTVAGTITLNVQDMGVDGENSGTIKSESVNLSMTVNPVADAVTLNVSQAVGDEDAEIPLVINVLSDDNQDITGGTNTDTKESYNVTISDIQSGSVIKYNGSELTVNEDGSVTIVDFDNNAPLTITPPENSDGDFNLKVSAQSKDGTDVSLSTDELLLNVQINDGADEVTGTLKEETIDGVTYNAVATEDNSNVDNGASFALRSIYNASPTSDDTDTSESMSLIITNLSGDFDISGAGATFLTGAGEDRKWVISDIDNVTINSSKNYSGIEEFKIGYITTEKAGDSLTQKDLDGLDSVKALIKPDAEAQINTSTDLLEDTLTKVDFGILYQNGDEDESIIEVKIKAEDVTSKEFSLYIGDSTTTSISSLTADEDGYYVLTAEQANNIYAQYSTDLGTATDTSFGIKYSVKDSIADTTIEDTEEKEATYTFDLSAVTDDIAIDATANDTANISVDNSDTTNEIITINNTGDFTVNVDFTAQTSDNSDADDDGSEKITHLVIEGVPDGISVDGGTYAKVEDGTNLWFVDVGQNFDETITISKTLTFKVNDELADGTDDYPITITAYNQDGEAEVTQASTNLTFVDNMNNTTGEGEDDSVDASMSVKEYQVIEDTPFSLDDIVLINDDTSITDEAYSITFTLNDLTNVTIDDTSMLNIYEKGGTTYYALNIGVGETISDELKKVEFTPTKDFNENNDSDTLIAVNNIKMTAYVPNSGNIIPAESLVDFEDSAVTPVTDEITLSLSDDSIDEDNTTETFDIDIQTVDDPNYTIVDDKITLSYASGVEGKLVDKDGDEYDLKSGSSIDLSESQLSGLKFIPNTNESGTTTFNYSVTTQENGASNSVTSTGSLSMSVTPVVDGIELSNLSATGVEYDLESDGQFIELKVSDNTLNSLSLIDNDDSETILRVLVDDLPNGFTVYYGDTNTMAINAGDNGTTRTVDGEEGIVNNTWSIPLSDGSKLPNIWIKVPEDWSGSIDNIKLSTVVQDSADGTVIEDTISQNFELSIDSVASDITIAPTQTIGKDYQWNAINLNANSEDTDGSETATFTLSAKDGSEALDDTARFRLSDGTILDDTQATFSEGTWTISNIPTDDLPNLEMMYHEYSGTLDISMITKDGESTLDMAVEGEFGLNITSSSSINLSQDSSNIDFDIVASSNTLEVIGRESDTAEENLILSEGINFDNISKIENIESIDLADGSHSISLSLSDIVKMTDTDNDIKISGDAADSVELKNDGNTWTAGSNIGGYTEYTYSGDETVKVSVDDNIATSIVA